MISNFMRANYPKQRGKWSQMSDLGPRRFFVALSPPDFVWRGRSVGPDIKTVVVIFIAISPRQVPIVLGRFLTTDCDRFIQVCCSNMHMIHLVHYFKATSRTNGKTNQSY